MTDFRNVPTAAASAGEEGDPRDFKALLRYLEFAVGAVRRRKLLTIFVFVLVMAVTVGLIRTTPKSYHAETKILAERQQALPSIMRSNTGDEAPTHAASEIIHRRDNLISIIQKTRLVDKWQISQSPELSADEKLNVLAKILDARLSVALGDGTVTISIDWPDGRMAYELVEAARQNFLEARRISEISTIDEAIVLMEARAESLRSEIDSIEGESQRQAANQETSALQPSRRGSSSRPATFDREGARLKAAIEAKRRYIRDAEDFNRRRLQELRAQFAKESTIYGKTHPSLLSLEEEIKTLSKEPPQLATERAELKQLEASYSSRASTSEAYEGDTTGARRKTAGSASDEADDIEGRLKSAQRKYETALERIESARIDLDTARTFFDHRYSIIRPAMVPTAPDKPNVRLYLAAGLILSLLLAAFAATAADLLAGRFVQRWQVEHVLQLAVLAEVHKQ